MYPETRLLPITQSSSVDGRPIAGTEVSTTSKVIAARVADWAASHKVSDDTALILNLRSVIEGALSEYFRFLSCDESLMVFNHASDGNAMLLILPAEERHWRVAYKNDADASDVTRVTLGKLLDNARNLRVRGTAASCPGWTYTREELPLNAFSRKLKLVPFVDVTEARYHWFPGSSEDSAARQRLAGFRTGC